MLTIIIVSGFLVCINENYHIAHHLLHSVFSPHPSTPPPAPEKVHYPQWVINTNVAISLSIYGITDINLKLVGGDDK